MNSVFPLNHTFFISPGNLLLSNHIRDLREHKALRFFNHKRHMRKRKNAYSQRLMFSFLTLTVVLHSSLFATMFIQAHHRKLVFHTYVFLCSLCGSFLTPRALLYSSKMLTTREFVFKNHVVFSHPTSISSHFSVVLPNFLTFVH